MKLRRSRSRTFKSLIAIAIAMIIGLSSCATNKTPPNVQQILFNCQRFQIESLAIVSKYETWMVADVGVVAIYDNAYKQRIIVAATREPATGTVARSTETPGYADILDFMEEGRPVFFSPLTEISDGVLRDDLIKAKKAAIAVAPINDPAGFLIGYVAFTFEIIDASTEEKALSYSQQAGLEISRLSGLF